jgi:hypothetical protein
MSCSADDDDDDDEILSVHYGSAGGYAYKRRVTLADNLCLGVAGWLVSIYGHWIFVFPPHLPVNWWRQTVSSSPENGTPMMNGLYKLWYRHQISICNLLNDARSVIKTM